MARRIFTQVFPKMSAQRFSVALVLALIFSITPLSSFAQTAEPLTAAPATEQVQATPELPTLLESKTSKSGVLSKFAKDHGAIWTAPLRIKRGDVKWLVPLGAGAAALVATGADWKVRENMADIKGVRPASKFLSHLGGGGPMMAASGAMFAIGKITKNDKAAETGKLAMEAVMHTQLLIGGIKMIANRERPNKVDGQGGFFSGGQSFPSGHAGTTFAFATVVADKYKSKWAKFGVYGFATAVSMARVGGLNHFPSDVIIGGTIGHLIGKFVLRRNASENH